MIVKYLVDTKEFITYIFENKYFVCNACVCEYLKQRHSFLKI